MTDPVCGMEVEPESAAAAGSDEEAPVTPEVANGDEAEESDETPSE